MAENVCKACDNTGQEYIERKTEAGDYEERLRSPCSVCGRRARYMQPQPAAVSGEPEKCKCAVSVPHWPEGKPLCRTCGLSLDSGAAPAQPFVTDRTVYECGHAIPLFAGIPAKHTWHSNQKCPNCQAATAQPVSAAISCLVCGHQKERCIVHEPSGQYVCFDCRDAVQQNAALREELNHERANIEMLAAKIACDKEAAEAELAKARKLPSAEELEQKIKRILGNWDHSESCPASVSDDLAKCECWHKDVAALAALQEGE